MESPALRQPGPVASLCWQRHDDRTLKDAPSFYMLTVSSSCFLFLYWPSILVLMYSRSISIRIFAISLCMGRVSFLIIRYFCCWQFVQKLKGNFTKRHVNFQSQPTLCFDTKLLTNVVFQSRCVFGSKQFLVGLLLFLILDWIFLYVACVKLTLTR